MESDREFKADRRADGRHPRAADARIRRDRPPSGQVVRAPCRCCAPSSDGDAGLDDFDRRRAADFDDEGGSACRCRRP